MLANEFAFRNAQPVWQTGNTKEVNKTLVFKTAVASGIEARICLACSTSYILYVNGQFVAQGPARTAHGYHRVDEISITEYLTKETNIVSVHVTSAYVPSYSISRHEAFLCAEILSGDTVIAFTSPEGDWRCCAYPYRVQKVHKYSEQRLFAEIYRLSPEVIAIDTELSTGDSVPLSVVSTGSFICRDVYYTNYEPLPPVKKIGQGTFTLKFPENQKMRIYYDQCVYEKDLGKFKFKCVGYPLEDQEYDYSMHAKKIRSHPDNCCNNQMTNVQLKKDEYFDLDMGCNYTGLIQTRVTCSEKTSLYVMFDEILDDNGDIDIMRLSCYNLIVWELEPGTYTLTSSEAYTLKYLRFACVEGACCVEDAKLLRVSFPSISRKLISDDKILQAVYDAAVETFRQNVYDVYMDCPSRERAGWLCDSFFTARAEYALTGKSTVERAFLANFLLPDSIPNIPKGMLPMCYPAELPQERYIPNWAMFFVLELEEYLERTGDTAYVQAAKPKMMDLLEFFRPYENEYGLLESLCNWVFVEWSQANKLTQDLNFPTNMLYARTKRALAKLYDMPELIKEADAMDEAIRNLSLDGLFFCDNALRQDGKLVLSGEHTETCQYYAFFCGTVTPQSHPELWDTMLTKFGPIRSEEYPEIWPSNTFIGHFLRLDLLHRFGYKDALIRNVVDYFYYMAERTGTLWENKTPHASCCHGFTSCLIYWLDQYGMLTAKEE